MINLDKTMKRTNIIYLTEMIDNKNKHRFAKSEYYLVYIVDDHGVSVPALFTDTEVAYAIDRASKNPEDCPRRRPVSSWKRKIANLLGIS